MRRISFNITQEQILARQKTVTRRLGWRNVRVGEQLRCVDRLRAKDAKTLAIIEVTDVRREPLKAMHPDDVAREGFGDVAARFVDAVPWFVTMFCKSMKCEPHTEVTRIEFKYVDEERP